MKKFKRLVATLVATSWVFSFFGEPLAVFAATDPELGAAASFSIVGQTAITGSGTISEDVGINSTGAGITGLTAGDVGGTIYSTDGVAPGLAILDPDVQADLSTANDNISAQGADDQIGPALDGLVVTTGVYDIGAGRLNGGVLTLDGPGIYIFRASSDLISSGSIDLTNGARACDVYWQVDTLATINGSEFTGTIIAGTGVHFGANVALDGRALALGGDVTLIDTTISGPGCAPAAATINVVKTVVNDNGGTNVVADFPLFVGATPVTSGDTNVFAPATYTVSETADPNYIQTFSGDCDVNGSVTIVPGDAKVCIITNNDIAVSGGGGGSGGSKVPPLIEVVKVPSPLALPDGPGLVEYTYTLSNIGTVSVTDITMVGDTCSPIVLVAGDTDGDARLDVGEIWVHRCSTSLLETHTNTVVATGWANGISAVDIASATVVVGDSAVPPLIHVTKVPSPLALPAGGGWVTYTKSVTNPGTVALSNVRLTDNKCNPLNYISGDMDNDSMLDTTETWIYTCLTNLAATTTNTVIAKGDANGLTATDFAIATVVVGLGFADSTNSVVLLPTLPATGSGLPRNAIWSIIAASFMAVAPPLFIFRKKLRVKVKSRYAKN